MIRLTVTLQFAWSMGCLYINNLIPRRLEGEGRKEPLLRTPGYEATSIHLMDTLNTNCFYRQIA